MDSIPNGPTLEKADGQLSAIPADLSRLHLTAAVLWTVVIMVLCWLPTGVVHEVKHRSLWLFNIHNLDKLVHAGIFLVFSILWLRVGASSRRWIWTIAGGVGLAALTELVQLLPAIGRDANIADGVTDFVGVLLGIALAPLIEPIIERIESRIFFRTDSQPLRLGVPSAAPGDGTDRAAN